MSKTFPVTMGRTGIQMIENLQIYDMIWGMCNLNRFTGKADRQVSVAAHSLHCYDMARMWQPDNPPLQLYALVHDLPEAYYGDFPGFLKNDLGADFVETLARIDDTILSQLGLSKNVRLALEPDLKRIDNNALTLEAAYAFDAFQPYHWPSTELLTNDITMIETLCAYDSVGMYNFFIDELQIVGQYNETLQDLLHRHRGYSHPRRDRLR